MFLESWSMAQGTILQMQSGSKHFYGIFYLLLQLLYTDENKTQSLIEV